VVLCHTTSHETPLRPLLHTPSNETSSALLKHVTSGVMPPLRVVALLPGVAPPLRGVAPSLWDIAPPLPGVTPPLWVVTSELQAVAPPLLGVTPPLLVVVPPLLGAMPTLRCVPFLIMSSVVRDGSLSSVLKQAVVFLLEKGLMPGSQARLGASRALSYTFPQCPELRVVYLPSFATLLLSFLLGISESPVARTDVNITHRATQIMKQLLPAAMLSHSRCESRTSTLVPPCSGPGPVG